MAYYKYKLTKGCLVKIGEDVWVYKHSDFMFGSGDIFSVEHLSDSPHSKGYINEFPNYMCTPLFLTQDEMIKKIKLNGGGLEFGILEKNKSSVEIEYISLEKALNYDYSQDLLYETEDSYRIKLK